VQWTCVLHACPKGRLGIIHGPIVTRLTNCLGYIITQLFCSTLFDDRLSVDLSRSIDNLFLVAGQHIDSAEGLAKDEKHYKM
jgi:hypothetical protein